MKSRQAIHEALDAYLGENELKRTWQRRAILDALLAAGGHVTIEEIVAGVQATHPRVGQATIYRAVRLFEAAGIVHRHALKPGLTHYELVLPAAGHHDHVVAIDCGKVFEFNDPVIEARQEALVRSFGLRVVAHRHVIHGQCIEPGRCDDCEHRRRSSTSREAGS